MKTIILIAVAAIVLLDLTDSLPKSSVGGPMAMLMIVFLAVLALGLYDAWSQRRGPLGWIVSVVAALAGGFLGVYLAGAILEAVLSHISLGGSLAASQHPLRYVASAGMMLFALLGALIAVKAASWRPR